MKSKVGLRSKSARICDLLAAKALEMSQVLSTQPSKSHPGQRSVIYVDPDVQAEILIERAGQVLQHTGLEQKEIAHGFLLYDLLSEHLDTLPKDSRVSVLEIGTARGFSLVALVKALHDKQMNGSVISLDIVPHHTGSYSLRGFPPNQLFARNEILEPWKKLLEGQATFLCGSSQTALLLLQQQRFSFAFVDEHHTYRNTSRDLNFLEKCQTRGDVIVVDDYGSKFPGVVKAVNEFVNLYNYELQLSQVTAERNLAILKRI